MPHKLPPLTVLRRVTNWGFAVAVRVEVDAPQRWAVVDAYGEMSDLGDPLYTDEQVSRWTNVYDAGGWKEWHSVTDSPSPEDLLTGSVKRCDEGVIAIKLDQPAGHPCWLVFTPVGSVDLVDDDHVREWVTAYSAQSCDIWASQHGLDPFPETREGIVSW